MGRVEEALRRAAEGQPDEPARETAIAGSTAGAFPAEFSRETTADVEEQRPIERPDPPVPDAIKAPADPAGATLLDRESPSKRGTAELTAKLVGDDLMLTKSREQYRRLAATLHQAQAISGVKVILIASAVAGEGKTLTASNLALTFSGSYEKRVLLIDADLRRPSLARTFNIPSSPGLSDGLLRGYEGKLPLHNVSNHLSVLPAGRATPDPMAGLTSERMRQLVAEARAAFDWVIIDTPPIGLMTDASLLSSVADGTILVVKANSTPYHLVRRAMEALGPGTLLGAVLNRETDSGRASKYYEYYHYSPTSKGPAAR